MPRSTTYHSRPVDELAALPSDGLVTIAELCEWRQISLSKYHRDRAAGLIQMPAFYGPASPRHTAAEMRGETMEVVSHAA